MTREDSANMLLRQLLAIWRKQWSTVVSIVDHRKKVQKYREVGMVEYIPRYTKARTPMSDHILWEVLGDTQFTKVIRNVLGRQARVTLTYLVISSSAMADHKRHCYRAVLLTIVNTTTKNGSHNSN